MADLGITFKNARESMGLTLEQIATETRIGTRFLEAIEGEKFNLLPGGIFSRGFVRSYAERLGLDPDKAVADFERLSNYREPSVMEGLRVSTEQPGVTNRKLYPIAIGALLALLVIVYVATRESTLTVTASPPPAVVTAPAVPPAPPPATTAEPTAATTPSEPVAAKEELTLDLNIIDTTWIKVTVDGNVLVAGDNLRSGTTRHFGGQSSIALVVGNAGGITIKVNNHDIAPLGASGQVRFLTITPDTLKNIIG